MRMQMNQKIVNWLVQKAEREYSGDIAVLVAYGSFINGTANEKSDVDCYFIPKTERGYRFAVDFILDGVGYDIFPMSWERVESISNLQESLLPCVGDVKILFYSTEEDLQRFQSIQEKLHSHLRNSKDMQEAAKERFFLACKLYAGMEKCVRLSAARLYAGRIIMALAESAAFYNQDYFHYGLKRQCEELAGFRRLPQNFLVGYLRVIQAENGEEACSRCFQLLQSMSTYTGWALKIVPREKKEATKKENKPPDYTALAALYEEICSTFQKIYVCCGTGDAVLAYLSAVCLQGVLDSLPQIDGLATLDVLSAYCYSDLSLLEQAAREVERKLVQAIETGGGAIKRFDSYEAFAKADL